LGYRAFFNSIKEKPMKQKKLVVSLVCATAVVLALAGVAGAKTEKACKWSDEAKLRSHLSMHVTYPSTGKAIKEACKKEMPDEFTKDERNCFEAKIQDKTEYKTADDVMTAVGITK
jgi:hypothetical protein